MKRILLVDDDPSVLSALRAKLAEARVPWQILTAPSGADALALLDRESCDVVVSDAGMPGMDGAELCQRVGERHPSVVRLMLVSDDERELAQRGAGHVHESVAKSCSSAMLHASLARGVALQDVLTHARLTNLVARLDHLPSMPALYFELVEAMKSPNATVESLGNIIAKDPGMTGKVLSIVNSTLFGLREKIVSPGQAATFLGLDTLKSLVLSVGVVSQFDEREMRDFSIQESWEHNMLVAQYARAILSCERATKTQLDEGFLAGMMHDAGKLVLVSNCPDRFEAAGLFAERDRAEREDVERRLFGGSHAAVGGYLLARWSLPVSVVEAVLYHHVPGQCREVEFGPLTAVHAANVLAQIDLSDGDAELAGLDHVYVEQLGLTDHVPRWIEACRAAGAAG